MKKDTVSVAICTYNGEVYISKQIESILNQTVLPDEIVICDDGSNDNTIHLINIISASSSIPFRIYINDSNLGSTKNFEKAINLCTKSVIILSDQDDVWEKSKVETIVDFFTKNQKTDLIFSNGRVIDDNDNRLGYTLWEAFGFRTRQQVKLNKGRAYDVLLKNNVVTGATMAFKANLRDLFIPIPKTWVHDGWIALLVSVVGRVDSIEKPLIEYRQHSKQQIGARELSLHQEINKATQTSREQYKVDAYRYQLVLDRLMSLNLVSEQHQYVKGIKNKINHLTLRSEISSNPKKVISIIKELPSLDYFRYSNGIKSIIKDILLK